MAIKVTEAKRSRSDDYNPKHPTTTLHQTNSLPEHCQHGATVCMKVRWLSSREMKYFARYDPEQRGVIVMRKR